MPGDELFINQASGVMSQCDRSPCHTLTSSWLPFFLTFYLSFRGHMHYISNYVDTATLCQLGLELDLYNLVFALSLISTTHTNRCKHITCTFFALNTIGVLSSKADYPSLHTCICYESNSTLTVKCWFSIFEPMACSCFVLQGILLWKGSFEQ